MSPKLTCDHLPALKVEKIANFIKKSVSKCTTKQHQSKQYSLCLHCGFTKCFGDGKSIEDPCAQQHAQSNKHQILYCFTCGINIEERDDDGNQKTEKFNEIFNKIHDLIKKNMKEEEKKNEETKKANKKQKTYEKVEKQKEEKQLRYKIPSTKEQNNCNLRVFGLSNIGNTCYFNSILQCLYSTTKLHQFYQSHEIKDDMNITFKKFLKNTEKVFCPKNIFSLVSKNFKFLKSMGQQDAFELYVLLIDSLIESAAKKVTNTQITMKQKIQSSVGSIFGFTLMNRLLCLSCKTIIWNKDFSIGLTIPITRHKPKNVTSLPENKKISQQQAGEDGLYYPDNQPSNNFLDNFFQLEVFDKSNGYKCEKCKSQNVCNKFYMREPPEILTVNFKMFNNSGSKINGEVQIPTQITLNSYSLTRGNYKYELYAGAVHHGSSRGGHYVAYTRRGNEWYYFSDSHFKPASLHSLKESRPYVIFYRRMHQYDDIVNKNEQINEDKEQTYSYSKQISKDQQSDCEISQQKNQNANKENEKQEIKQPPKNVNQVQERQKQQQIHQ